MLLLQEDGKINELILGPVKICPNSTKQLISITNEILNGAKLLYNGQNDIILTYPNGDKMIFDCQLKTSLIWILRMEVMSNDDEIAKL